VFAQGALFCFLPPLKGLKGGNDRSVIVLDRMRKGSEWDFFRVARFFTDCAVSLRNIAKRLGVYSQDSSRILDT
jgi:hypothetical protein